MKVETYFKIGDVVAYNRHGLPNHMSPAPRYAQIVSLKVDKDGIWYEMSDDIIHDSNGGPRKQSECYSGSWVAQDRIVARYTQARDLIEPQAAER